MGTKKTDQTNNSVEHKGLVINGEELNANAILEKIESVFLPLGNGSIPDKITTAFEEALKSWLLMDDRSFVEAMNFIGEEGEVGSEPRDLNLAGKNGDVEDERADKDELDDKNKAQDDDKLGANQADNDGKINISYENGGEPLGEGSGAPSIDNFNGRNGGPNDGNNPGGRQPALPGDSDGPPHNDNKMITPPEPAGPVGRPNAVPIEIHLDQQDLLNGPQIINDNIFSHIPATFGPLGGGDLFIRFIPPSSGIEDYSDPNDDRLVTSSNNELHLLESPANLGDIIFDYLHPYLVSQVLPGEIFIDSTGQRYFTITMEYSLTDNGGHVDSAPITLIIKDGHPVADDLVNPNPIDESEINNPPFIGSDITSPPNVLTGNLFDGPNTIGPNGGTITDVKLDGGGGTTIITTTEIIVTDLEGNELIIDPNTGDYTFTLSHPFVNDDALNSSDPNEDFEDIFHFTFVDNNGNVDEGNLTIVSIDDRPVALDTHMGIILENDIKNTPPISGSNLLTIPATISGVLVPEPPTLSTSRWGADGPQDGGGVTNVTFVSVNGATEDGVTPVTATTSFSTITAAQITDSNGAFDALNLGHNSIVVTDSLGNQLIIDRETTDFYYILNKAFHNDVPDVACLVTYDYQLTDFDGSDEHALLTVTVGDDHPIAVDITAPGIDEANIIAPFGSNLLPNPEVTGGILVETPSTLLTSRYGADGPDPNGGVSNITFSSVSGASMDGINPVTANTIAYIITAADIDASEGNLTAASIGHNAWLNTDSLGNKLIVDSVTSEFYYQLNKAFHNDIPDVACNVNWIYELKDSDGSVRSAQLQITVQDDHPVAVNITAPGIDEANIIAPFGSNLLPNPEVTGGILVETPSTLLTSRYGADGPDPNGGVSNVTLSLVSGASADGVNPVTANTVAHIITQADIDASEGNLTAANLGHNALLNTDSLGNILVIDRITSEFYYQLNKAFHNDIPDVACNVNWIYELKDSDGSVRSAQLQITVQDDHPVAVNITAPGIDEANIIAPFGSNLLPNPEVTGGILVETPSTLLTSRYGADGPDPNGGVSNVTLSLVSGASADGVNPVTANTVAHIITQADIDASEGNLTAANLGHNALLNTDSLGNILVIDRITSEFYYQLNKAFHNDIPDVACNVNWIYELKDSDGSVRSAQLQITVQDDHPVAVNITAPGIDEANIINAGSSFSNTPETTGGMLVPNPSSLAASRYGADGADPNGGVSNVMLSSVSGATADGINPVTATTIAHVIDANDVAGSQGNLTAANIGHSAWLNTDSLGNQLIIDRVTSDFYYKLNKAFHNNTPNVASNLNFIYELRDSDGSVRSAQLQISVADDKPIAAVVNGAVQESDILTVGSNQSGVPETTNGFLISKAPGFSYFGADGAGSNGGILSLSFSSASGASPVGAGASSYATTLNGHAAIGANDSLGNSLVIDLTTYQWVYTLNKALHDNIPNTNASETFNYTLIDSDGSTATSSFIITISDDQPVGINQNAGSVQEADIQNIGSNLLNSSEVITGTLISRFGADGPGSISTISFTSITGASAGPGSSSQSTTINGHPGIMATDSLGNTLVIDQTTLQYYYTLNKAFAHTTPNTTATEVFTYTITDSDGSSKNAQLSIQIADDHPIAVAVNGSVQEADILTVGSNQSGVPETTTGILIANSPGVSHFGADGAGNNGGILSLSFSSASGASPVGAGASSYATTLNGYAAIGANDSLGNSLVIDLTTYQWVYTLNKALHDNIPNTNASETFNYTLIDSDGSTATSSFVITISDDQPVAVNQNAGTVQEANIQNIGSNSSPNPQVLTGTLTSLFGADGKGSISSLTFSSITGAAAGSGSGSASQPTIINGHPGIMATDFSGNTLVIDQTTLQYYYTLNNAFFHLVPNTTATEVFTFTITDSDGSSKNGQISIQIVDDHPIAPDQNAGTISESVTQVQLNGNIPGVEYGADIPGGVSVTLTSSTGSTATPGSSFSTTLNGNPAVGFSDSEGNKLIIDITNFNYVYQLNNPLHHNTPNTNAIEVFTYVVTDNDGSSDSGTITITISDGGPTGANDVGTVNISTSNPSDSGIITSNYGPDGPGTITTLTLTSTTGTDGSVSPGFSSVPTTVGSDPGIYATDNYGNQLTINITTGTWTYVLADRPPADADPGTKMTETFTYTLVDEDGSTTTATIIIPFAENSFPDAIDQTVAAGQLLEANIHFIGSNKAVDNSDTFGGTLVPGLGATFGSDGPAASGGVTGINFISISGASPIFAATTLSTITQTDINDSNGTLNASDLGHKAYRVLDSLDNLLVVDAVSTKYYYVLNSPFHDSIPGQPATLNFNYVLTDSDGDSDNATLSIVVNDDAPIAYSVLGADVRENQIENDGVLSEGAALMTVPYTISGILPPGNTYGADEADAGPYGGGIVDLYFSGIVGASPVGKGTTSMTTVNGHNAIKATDSLGNFLIIDQVTNQTYYTLVKSPFETNPGGTATGTFVYTLRDSDGSTASGNFDIIFRDDNPAARVINASISQTPVGPVTITGDFIPASPTSADPRFGADGPQTANAFNGGITALSWFNSTNTSGVSGGISSSHIIFGGHDAIEARDSLGNRLIIDEVTYQYTYILNADFTNTGSGDMFERFSYSMTDGDGSVRSANFVLRISDTPSGSPTATPVNAGLIDEGNIANIGSNNLSSPNTVSGTLVSLAAFGPDGPQTANDFGGGITKLSFSSISGATGVGAGISSQATTFAGHDAIMATDSLGNVLIVDEVTRLYYYTLNTAVDHNAPGGTATETFSYTLTDDDGTTSTSTFSINIADDAPIAATNTFNVSANSGPQPSYNLLITFDYSNSMKNTFTSGPNAGLTQIQVANTAIAELLNAYEDITMNLNIQILTYNNSNTMPTKEFTSPIFTDAASAINWFTTVPQTALGTHFPPAAARTENAMVALDAFAPTYLNQAYWLSDGLQTGTTLTAADYSNFQNTLTATGFNEIAVNVGSNLAKIAKGDDTLDGLASPTNSPLVLHPNTDWSDLANTLVGTVPVQPGVIKGNVLTNDELGADTTTKLFEIDLFFANNAQALAYDAAHPGLNITVSGSTVMIAVPQDDTFITIPTEQGGSLKIKDTGKFVYNSGSINTNTTDVVQYKIVDDDGSVHQAQVTFNVAVDPIILDLHGDGIHFIDAEHSGMSVSFSNGDRQQIGWIGDGDGILVLHDGSGKISDVSQMELTFDKLREYDSNFDGKLDATDKDFSHFGILLADGQFDTLDHQGVLSIDLNASNHLEEANGNTIVAKSSFVNAQGEHLDAIGVNFGLKYQAQGDLLNVKDVLPNADHGQLDFSKLPQNHVEPAAPAGHDVQQAASSPAVEASQAPGAAQQATSIVVPSEATAPAPHMEQIVQQVEQAVAQQQVHQ